MSKEKPYKAIGEEIEGLAKQIKKLSTETEAEERAELAYDLRRCQQELFMTGSFAPALAEQVNEYLETTLMPLLEEHLQNVFHEMYVSRLSESGQARLRERIIADLRSQYEQPIRQQVALEIDSIRARVRTEQTEAIRAELKDELRPLVTKELHDELMRKLIE